MFAAAFPVSRRHFLALAGGFAAAQFCAAIESEASALAPQPYFAGVNRVLEALARLGAPVAAGETWTCIRESWRPGALSSRRLGYLAECASNWRLRSNEPETLFGNCRRLIRVMLRQLHSF